MTASVEVVDSTLRQSSPLRQDYAGQAGQASSPQTGRVVGQIGKGLLVYLSIGRADSDKDADFMAEKLTGLRIFADEAGPSTPSTTLGTGPLRAGKMNLSIRDVGGPASPDSSAEGETSPLSGQASRGGGILLVSNFTLHGDCRKGRRPGFDAAAEPAMAQRLYERVAQLIADRGVRVAKGVFGAYMQVKSINDGPATFLLDSSRLF